MRKEESPVMFWSQRVSQIVINSVIIATWTEDSGCRMGCAMWKGFVEDLALSYFLLDESPRKAGQLEQHTSEKQGHD